jgi:ubiquinone/menaquinone biosynthesis C-methylase UbiE
MLTVGVDRHDHPLVEYSLTNGEDLTFLTDKSMDAAICCLVLVNVSHAERIQRLTREVHRVLRPGGRFIVLDVQTAPESSSPATVTACRGKPTAMVSSARL